MTREEQIRKAATVAASLVRFPNVFPMEAVPDIKKNHLTLLYENL